MRTQIGMAGIILATVLPTFGATADFAPSAIQATPGSIVSFDVTITAESLAGIDAFSALFTGDVPFTFSLSPTAVAAFANVQQPTAAGLLPNDLFTGGNNPSSVGTQILIGTLRVDTTAMTVGTEASFAVAQPPALLVSTTSFQGNDEALSGSATLEIVASSGACCLSASTCDDGADQVTCENLGGVFQGPGTNCASVICPCVPSGMERCDGVDNDCDGSVDEDFIGLNQPCSEGTGSCQVNGTLVCAADGSSTVCDALVTLGGDLFPPGDLNRDLLIDPFEVTRYSACFSLSCVDWPGGGPLPPDGPHATRMAELFVRGEDYCCDLAQTPPQRWPSADPCCPTDPGCPVATEASELANAVARESATRTFVSAGPMETEVSINPALPHESAVYAVEERIPAGLAVDEVSDGGVFSAGWQWIRWGPFLDNVPRTLTYRIKSSAGQVNRQEIQGILSVDGRSVPVRNSVANNHSRADSDSDGDVDLADFLKLVHCFSGTNRAATPECARRFDFDSDDDIDLADIVVFQTLFTQR